MGKATIISDLGAGQYRVQPVVDTTRAQADIARLQTESTAIDTRLLELVGEISAAEFTADNVAAELHAAIINGDIEVIAEKQTAHRKAAATLTALIGNREYLTLRKAANSKRIDWLQQETAQPAALDAWCADFTDGLTGEVATAELGRNPTPPIIRPGDTSAYSAARDGQLQPPASSTPAAVFYNAAMQPGLSKWRPRYRTGTASNIDLDLDTMSVTLDALTIAGQNVNQATTLNDVPVQYMTCNARAFTAGNAVLVEFTGMDWSSPVVVGFVHDPQPCDLFGWWLNWTTSTLGFSYLTRRMENGIIIDGTVSVPIYRYLSDRRVERSCVFNDVLTSFIPPAFSGDIYQIFDRELLGGTQTVWATYPDTSVVCGVACNATRRYVLIIPAGTPDAQLDVYDNTFSLLYTRTITDYDVSLTAIAATDSYLVITGVVWFPPAAGNTAQVRFYDLDGIETSRIGGDPVDGVYDTDNLYSYLYAGPGAIIGYKGRWGYPREIENVAEIKPAGITVIENVLGASEELLNDQWGAQIGGVIWTGCVVDDLVFGFVATRSTTSTVRWYSRESTNDPFVKHSKQLLDDQLQGNTLWFYHLRGQERTRL